MRGYDFQKMIKQAQKMQSAVLTAQEELEKTLFTGSTASGLITVTVNGKNDFKNISIKPEAINPENPASVDKETIEMLEDLISAAFKDANNKANNAAQNKMEGITGGMDLPPGIL